MTKTCSNNNAMSLYGLRPIAHKTGKPDLKDIYKIFIPSKLYISLRSGAKDLWILENEDGTVTAMGKIAQAQDEVQNKVIQVSQGFKDLFGLSFTESYSLKKSSMPLRYANEVLLEITGDAAVQSSPEFWRGALGVVLPDKLVSPGLELIDVEVSGLKESFKVISISNTHGSELTNMLDIHSVSKDCNIRIQLPKIKTSQPAGGTFEIDRTGLFGLEAQLDKIDDVVLSHDLTLKPPLPFIDTGLLLISPHEPTRSGITGRISSLPWRGRTKLTQEMIGKGSKDSIQSIFMESLKLQPHIIEIENLENLVANNKQLQNSLLEAFDITYDERVLVVAEVQDSTRIPKAILDAFSETIQLPLPDEAAKKEFILRELKRRGVTLSSKDSADAISQKSPGYSNRNMQRLLDYAVKKAGLQRFRQASRDSTILDNSQSSITVSLDDFEQARSRISLSDDAKAQPTSHRKVRWADIGGQEQTKRLVEELFEWPLKYPEMYKAMKMEPGKGLLLYGPPGCSKTMTALALATEAKMNFIPVKGSELISKFVGESEKNLRAVFAQARSIAPCVIFFDEFDAIASSAGGERDNGVSLVTTLLNELDGFHDLKGVSILAATNTPWKLDLGVIRPGRIDAFIYVKLPDATTRKDIFDIQLKDRSHGHIDVPRLVTETEGCTGAEVVNLNHSAIMAAMREAISDGKTVCTVEERHFDEALQTLRKYIDAESIARFDAFADRARTAETGGGGGSWFVSPSNRK